MAVQNAILVTVWIPKYTEGQQQLSGVNSIMMEKLAQASQGGGCTPTPFHYIYHHVQSCGIGSSWEGSSTPPLFLLYPYMFSVLWTIRNPHKVLNKCTVCLSVCNGDFSSLTTWVHLHHILIQDSFRKLCTATMKLTHMNPARSNNINNQCC
jgi:hypothetical protein